MSAWWRTTAMDQFDLFSVLHPKDELTDERQARRHVLPLTQEFLEHGAFDP
jgi:hypothetical protein